MVINFQRQYLEFGVYCISESCDSTQSDGFLGSIARRLAHSLDFKSLLSYHCFNVKLDYHLDYSLRAPLATG